MSNMSKLSLTEVTNLVSVTVKRLSALEWQKHKVVLYGESQLGNKHCVAICKCYQFLPRPPSLPQPQSNPMSAGQVQFWP